MADRGVTQEQLSQAVDSLRTEITAGLTTAGVQIGAVEKTLNAKLSSLRAWGVAALVGGQTLAGLAGALILKTGDPAAPAKVALEALSKLPLV